MLEDLGDDLYATLIAAGDDEAPLYDAAVDTLVKLHAEAPPAVLEGGGSRWPLLTYDSLVLQTGAGLFLEWWPKYAGMAPFSQAALDDWEAFWAPIRARGEARRIGLLPPRLPRREPALAAARGRPRRGSACWTSRTR